MTSMGTILIADHEPDLVGACERLLRRAGWPVLTAGTAREALAALAATPDTRLVIVDRRLDEGDGLAISRQARTTGVPVLVITGFGSSTTRRALLDEGAAGFLAKPFSTRELLAQVRSIVGDPSDRRLPPSGAGGPDGCRPSLRR